MDFFNTVMGKRFIEGTMPSIARNLEKLVDCLEKKEKGNPDMLNISWGIAEVMHQAEEDGKEISKKDARNILRVMESNHDANIGVNWEVISENIGTYLEKKNKE